MTDIYIEADGTAQAVYDDTLVELFNWRDLATRRASHVEPVGGGWVADMGPVGGPVLAVCRTRAEALASERAWLDGRLVQGRL